MARCQPSDPPPNTQGTGLNSLLSEDAPTETWSEALLQAWLVVVWIVHVECIACYTVLRLIIVSFPNLTTLNQLGRGSQLMRQPECEFSPLFSLISLYFNTITLYLAPLLYSLYLV